MPCEDHAREKIDQLLEQAGWKIFDVKDANIHASQGVAIREFPLKTGHGFADYLLYVDGKAVGVIEAKKEGTTLTGVETQSEKYTTGLPDGLPYYVKPLPFCYESTGTETRFTNNLDPDPRSRPVFAFHKPKLFADAAEAAENQTADADGIYTHKATTMLGRLQNMPDLIEEGLWPAQIKAIKNLEISLKQNRPRALIQMATGSGKTFTAINFIYRLVKFAGARRVLFLADRGNLCDQTLKEFQQFVSPYNNFKFTEEFIAQRLASNNLDFTARVCISTIQRMFSMLKGTEISEEDEEQTTAGLERLYKEPPPIEYNPAIPIETFDIIVVDECHRSIYNLWRQVLEYFDAHIIGLTATPDKLTFGFFNQNLVTEYTHEDAVADGVNVPYDVYRIRTKITEKGSTIESGIWVDKRNRLTREERKELLDDDLDYDSNELDRTVLSKDQIRTVIQTFKKDLFTKIFPGRTEVPKTLIFAKDDHHADEIVQIVREEFAKGNEFAQKITYKTTGVKPKDLIQSFRNSYHPRIAVTVDMIATGTDIKPCEIVFFMRSVKSRNFFDQMKGRGVRIITKDDLKGVTPDAESKDHFVIVDAVGVCERIKSDSRSLESKPHVPLEKILQAVRLGNRVDEVLTSLAGRLARLNHQFTDEEKHQIEKITDGLSLKGMSRTLLDSCDQDKQIEQAKLEQGIPQGSDEQPSEESIAKATSTLKNESAKPFGDPKLEQTLLEIIRKKEITIDIVSPDELLESGYSEDAKVRAKGIVKSFEQFIQENKDELTALQILFSKPYKAKLKFEDVQELAEKIAAPPRLWSESQLWQAYAALDESKVKGAGLRRILTDLVSLVRFAMHQENELVPFPEKVATNFKAWLSQQESEGNNFTDEQRQWLVMIRDHIAANLGIETEDFDYAPFAQEGGLGKVYQLFGDELNVIIEELNESLAA
jgi:type I restriction enzyme R subunit